MELRLILVVKADFSCQNAVLSKNSWYVLVQIQ